MKTKDTGHYLTRAILYIILPGMLCGLLAQSSIRISGYGNTHFMDHDGTPNFTGRELDKSFIQLREFSLFFDMAITDAIIASTELEASNNGNDYTANYAYVDIQATDNLSFRVGKLLVPFLSYNENKPNFKQNLMSQPFTAWNLAPVVPVPIEFHGIGWSDAGAMANWNTFIEDVGLLDVKLAVINGLGSESNVLDDNAVQLNDGAGLPYVRPRDGLIQNDEASELIDNNGNKATVVKISFKTLAFPMDAGLSWYRGKWDNNDSKNLEMLGGHFNWLSRNWTFKGEYVVAAVEQDAGLDPVAAAGLSGPSSINTTVGNYNMSAYYAEASATPFHWDNSRHLKFVARYDAVDTNDKAVFNPFDRSRITVGLEWQLGKNTRLRYEYQRSTINDFDKAPAPYKKAGGNETIEMHMPSLIFSF